METDIKPKKYRIEHRIFKDTSWFGGWFKSMKPHWSEWTKFKDCDNLCDLKKEYESLLANKHKLKYRTEYRMIND